MGFIEDFNLIMNQSKKETREAEVIKFLNEADYSNPEVVEYCLAHVRHIIDMISQNIDIDALQAKTVYCMLAKMELEKLGLPQVPVNFIPRTEQHGSTGAFYDTTAHSVNFFNEVVAHPKDLLEHCMVGDGKGGIKPFPERRLQYLANELFKMEHELEHAVQWQKMREATEHPERLTADIYLYMRQHLARIITYNDWSRYHFGDAKNEDIYHNNHDQFIYEIAADRAGLERLKVLLHTLNPTLERVGFREYEREKLETRKEQMDDYNDTIKWRHSTNPNRSGLVGGNYKSSMIIDATMALGMQHPDFLRTTFEQYPFVALTHHADGRKKTLQEIEGYFSQKIAEADNGSLQGFYKASKIRELYETVVESDAVLSFERCLESILNVSAISDEYTTKGGLHVKSGKVSSRFVYSTRKKLEELAGYIETEDIKRIEEILKEYQLRVKAGQHEEMKVKLSDLTDEREIQEHLKERELYLSKLEVFRWVGFALGSNRDYRGVKSAETQQQVAERAKLQMATQLLTTVFPGFNPRPIYYEFDPTGTAPIATDNDVEKYVVMKSFERLQAAYLKISSHVKPEDKIALASVREAIKTVYNFNISDKQLARFEEQFKNGDFELIPDKFSAMMSSMGTDSGKK